MVYVIGIGGGTGAGKTRIANELAGAVPDELVTRIEYDSYYRDLSHLSLEERAAVNFDHPDALETELLVQHLDTLGRGEPIEVPVYDFATHARTEETRPELATPIVIVEGILTLADAALRERLDLKVFVDTDADIRVFRRIMRDMRDRGRTLEGIRAQYYESVRPMHLQFVEPSKRYADVIIPEGAGIGALDLLVTKIRDVAASAAASGAR